MARLVLHNATSPVKIDPAAAPDTPGAWPRDPQGNLKPVFVCACGLSSQFPFCDGTHKGCREEQAGHVYTYDPVTKRVIDHRPE